MMNKYYMIPNSKNLNKFTQELILPLEEYSIGFDVYFTCEEIEKIAKTREVNVIINSFLHKDKLKNIEDILKRMPSVKYFFIEDLGLINIIEKERIVVNQSHIINNYRSVNYFKSLNINNIVLSNELTIEELNVIEKNTSSNLFLFLISRNSFMYSKRHLVSSYYEYKGISGSKIKEIEENVSKKHLIIKEEDGGTIIFDKNIFSANEFIDELNNFNFIINFSNMNEEETDIILNHYKDKNLGDYIVIDNYFSKNKIGYKVGEVK